MIVLVNKWDLVEKESNTTVAIERDIGKKQHPLQIIRYFLFQQQTNREYTKFLNSLNR